MLRTGAEYLESLNDGRTVFLGKERVRDVTAYPAFRNTARSFARIYDAIRSPEHVEAMSYEEAGERFAAWYLLPTTREDLRRRAEAHRRVAEWSFGLLGRSMDHVASFVTGMRMVPPLFEGNRTGFGDNLVRYFEHMRRNDVFACYLVLTQQAARSADFYKRATIRNAGLRVVQEDDRGVTLSGMKMLGTSAVFSDEAWIGNILPLSQDEKDQAVTCAVPINTPGVQIWVRKSYERQAASRIDNYFSSQFDETDAVLLFDRVKVPWERVFVMDDVGLSRDIYFKTPAHIMGNHQSIIRFCEKLKLMSGIAHQAAELSGVLHLQPVQQTLGRLAAAEASLLGLVAGQVDQCESMVPGFVNVNKRYLYAALHWCANNYYVLADTVKELLSAGPFQLPADASVFEDDDLTLAFQANFDAPGGPALQRFKFIKMAWDLLGSEFGARHTQYERFYAGPPFMNDMYSFWNAPWDERRAKVDRILADMHLPAAIEAAAE
jgi:4-hydroxyphenylacetate 3-monooxygenase